MLLWTRWMRFWQPSRKFLARSPKTGIFFESFHFFLLKMVPGRKKLSFDRNSWKNFGCRCQIWFFRLPKYVFQRTKKNKFFEILKRYFSLWQFLWRRKIQVWHHPTEIFVHFLSARLPVLCFPPHSFNFYFQFIDIPFDFFSAVGVRNRRSSKVLLWISLTPGSQKRLSLFYQHVSGNVNFSPQTVSFSEFPRFCSAFFLNLSFPKQNRAFWLDCKNSEARQNYFTLIYKGKEFWTESVMTSSSNTHKKTLCLLHICTGTEGR